MSSAERVDDDVILVQLDVWDRTKTNIEPVRQKQIKTAKKFSKSLEHNLHLHTYKHTHTHVHRHTHTYIHTQVKVPVNLKISTVEMAIDVIRKPPEVKRLTL